MQIVRDLLVCLTYSQAARKLDIPVCTAQPHQRSGKAERPLSPTPGNRKREHARQDRYAEQCCCKSGPCAHMYHAISTRPHHSSSSDHFDGSLVLPVLGLDVFGRVTCLGNSLTALTAVTTIEAAPSTCQRSHTNCADPANNRQQPDKEEAGNDMEMGMGTETSTPYLASCAVSHFAPCCIASQRCCPLFVLCRRLEGDQQAKVCCMQDKILSQAC